MFKKISDMFLEKFVTNSLTIDEFRIGYTCIFYIYAFNSKSSNIVKIMEDSILYFFEYISQIKDEKNCFLQLKPKDVHSFLYKKYLIGSNCTGGFVFEPQLLETYYEGISLIKQFRHDKEEFINQWRAAAAAASPRPPVASH
jgi:hypothetical protein